MKKQQCPAFILTEKNNGKNLMNKQINTDLKHCQVSHEEDEEAKTKQNKTKSSTTK